MQEVWRRRGDSNPRYPNRVRQFSKLLVSATHPPLQLYLLELLVSPIVKHPILKSFAKIQLFIKLGKNIFYFCPVYTIIIIF